MRAERLDVAGDLTFEPRVRGDAEDGTGIVCQRRTTLSQQPRALGGVAADFEARSQRTLRFGNLSCE